MQPESTNKGTGRGNRDAVLLLQYVKGKGGFSNELDLQEVKNLIVNSTGYPYSQVCSIVLIASNIGQCVVKSDTARRVKPIYRRLKDAGIYVKYEYVD